MATGLFGYLGYDMARQVEKLPNAPPDTLGLPDAILLRPTITAIFDSVRDEIIVVTPVWPDSKVISTHSIKGVLHTPQMLKSTDGFHHRFDNAQIDLCNAVVFEIVLERRQEIDIDDDLLIYDRAIP